MDAIRSLQKALATPETSDSRLRLIALKNNLGHALISLGSLQRDETILREGIGLLRDVLRSIDQWQNASLFALTQRNLASALMMLAATTKSEDDVEEAIERYGLALRIFEETGQEELAASTRRELEPLLSHRPPSVAEHDPAAARPADTAKFGDAARSDDATKREGAAKAEDAESDVIAEDRSQPAIKPVNPDVELRIYGSVAFTAVTGREDILNDDGSGYDDEFSADPEVNIGASFATDAGFDYGADVSLDVEDLSGTTSVMHFSGGFGELRFGQDSGAEDDMYIGGGDYQAGTGGIDGDAANLVDVSLTGSDDAIKMSYYTPRQQGVQFGLSFTPDTVDVMDEAAGDDDAEDEGRFEDHVGLGVNWVGRLAGADILATVVGSYGQAVMGDDLSSYAVGGGVALGPVQFGTGYTVEPSFNDRELLNFGVLRTFDPWFDGLGKSRLGAGVAFQFPENANNSTVWALSADTELAAGL
ncbi:MAG: porin, partial [Geminicoccaceae bacterium]